tara:strand:- start:950 stop:1456 length:507 start_codon:yes stop_codon:yes gene_type:complete
MYKIPTRGQIKIMLKGLKNLIFGNDEEENVSAGSHNEAALHHAAAGLLIEAAMMDGNFDNTERTKITNLLIKQFNLPEDVVNEIIGAAEEANAELVELYSITKVVRDHFDESERIRMIEMLWEVIYSDGKLDDFETNMMRRVGGLLYVSDRENGDAKKRAARLANGES